MKTTLRLFLTFFTILCGTTIAGAAVQEMHAGVVFEKSYVLERGTGFSAEFVAPKRLGTLTRAGENVYDSAGGLRYAGTDRAGLNRVQHVLRHAEADPSRATHSVFNVGRNKVLGLVDEAWGMRGSPLANDPGAYIVPMGRTVGTAGENAVKIIVRPGTNEIITSYPVIVP